MGIWPCKSRGVILDWKQAPPPPLCTPGNFPRSRGHRHGCLPRWNGDRPQIGSHAVGQQFRRAEALADTLAVLQTSRPAQKIRWGPRAFTPDAEVGISVCMLNPEPPLTRVCWFFNRLQMSIPTDPFSPRGRMSCRFF